MSGTQMVSNNHLTSYFKHIQPEEKSAKVKQIKTGFNKIFGASTIYW